MAGLPRSGGTMLSSILSQNPDIYVSPQSVLPNTLAATYNQYQSQENKDADQWDNIYRVMEMIIPTFYGGNSEKYIIDRNFSWLDAHPYVVLENHLKNEIRVICPVRNILDILASWNKLCENDKSNTYDKEILKVIKNKKPMADKRAQYFMEHVGSENGLRSSLHNMTRAMYPEFKDKILFVDYDDLVSDTNAQLARVYNFLGIDYFESDLNNLQATHEYKDAWGVKDHHKVKPTISKEEYIYDDIFLPSTIKEYSGLEFWKNL